MMCEERKKSREKEEREVEEKEACIIDVCVLLYFVACVCVVERQLWGML